MSRYNLAVVDDEPRIRVLLRELCSEWAHLRGASLCVSEYESSETYLFSDASADILLLDIEMQALSGVELAKRIRQRDETAQIIFVTGYSEYIAEGYEVSALNYLMKSVQKDKLFSTLDRAAARLKSEEKALVIRTADGVVRVPLRQIRYVDVQGNYLTVHAREDHTVRKTMNELISELDSRFYRLGRSAAVNLSCIRRVSRSEVILDDDTVLPLPRGAYEGVNRAIINLQ